MGGFLKFVRLQSGVHPFSDICRIITDYFVPQFPLLKMMDNIDRKEFARIITQTCHRRLNQNVSIGCYDGDRLVGVALNRIASRDDRHDDVIMNKSEQYTKYERYMKYCFRDVLDELNTDRALHCGYGCVVDGYQQKGLSLQLAHQSMKAGRAEGCAIVNVLAGSGYIRKKSLDDGWSILREFRFTDYVDAVSGEKLFVRTLPGHDISTVFYKSLTDESAKL